ncbi:hypothetical protein DL89DRAFT_268048 [Linderina pennispora]|uniref:Uncharacterized protein n=1 Tax=Linderina pennispora TaxID=61395 RepID=A0A1Y1W680_9FUNG|nr:uncharacterized protein DL89DRAFT_268048 [Linderina pennispora]ORX69011.1 hypothetical protein DL89DRAFT_268048 [Linderina pennispora]
MKLPSLSFVGLNLGLAGIALSAVFKLTREQYICVKEIWAFNSGYIESRIVQIDPSSLTREQKKALDAVFDEGQTPGINVTLQFITNPTQLQAEAVLGVFDDYERSVLFGNCTF